MDGVFLYLKDFLECRWIVPSVYHLSIFDWYFYSLSWFEIVNITSFPTWNDFIIVLFHLVYARLLGLIWFVYLNDVVRACGFFTSKNCKLIHFPSGVKWDICEYIRQALSCIISSFVIVNFMNSYITHLSFARWSFTIKNCVVMTGILYLNRKLIMYWIQTLETYNV